MNEYQLMFCLAAIVQAYDDLPESYDDFEQWIEHARKLCEVYKQNDVLVASLAKT